MIVLKIIDHIEWYGCDFQPGLSNKGSTFCRLEGRHSFPWGGLSFPSLALPCRLCSCSGVCGCCCGGCRCHKSPSPLDSGGWYWPPRDCSSCPPLEVVPGAPCLLVDLAALGCCRRSCLSSSAFGAYLQGKWRASVFEAYLKGR